MIIFLQSHIQQKTKRRAVKFDIEHGHCTVEFRLNVSTFQNNTEKDENMSLKYTFAVSRIICVMSFEVRLFL